MNQQEDLKNLNDLKKHLFSDGVLSSEDVVQLRAALLDGGMTRQKGNFLFTLKDSLNRLRVAQEFKPMFVEIITDLLLADEDTPGEISDSEAKWLRAKIQSNPIIDEYDAALLANLREKSINFPKILNFKSRKARKFEHFLYFSRYLTLAAVVGSLISAVALFCKGTVVVYDAIVEFIFNFGSHDYDGLMKMFVSSIDIYLFAMVLIIFAIGVYELFISKIDPVSQKTDGRPSWMHIESIDDLKSSLGKVILMVLIVTFFKYSFEVKYTDVNALLKLSFGIVLIASALYITNKGHHK